MLEVWVTTTNSWIGDVLRKFQLHEYPSDDILVEKYRTIIVRSRLPERLSETSSAINKQSGEGLLYEEVFVQPNPQFRRYVFEKDGVEFCMALVIQSQGPTLIFSWLKASSWVGNVYRGIKSEISPRFNTVCKLVVDPDTIGDADLQGWFTYLLSEI